MRFNWKINNKAIKRLLLIDLLFVFFSFFSFFLRITQVEKILRYIIEISSGGQEDVYF